MKAIGRYSARVMFHHSSLLAALCLIIIAANAWGTNATVDFARHLRDWDGFGVNYVETRHTRDYEKFPQDYGGFKYLDDAQRAQVIDLIFGADGLKPAIVKVFCDPFHEPVNDNDDPHTIDLSKFDHLTTTRWIRYFAREGLKTTRARGGELVFLAGLYGPPGWMTTQKTLRGRDLDPGMGPELAEYIASWAKHLRDVEGLPVKYISMHNEGEDPRRWPADGRDSPQSYDHDYNLWWPDMQVVSFLKEAREVLDRNGLTDVGLTCGETTSWRRLHRWDLPDGRTMQFAQRIADDPDALRDLALITSHGFNKQYISDGIDLLRAKRPELHAWTTSYTWGDMSLDLVEEARRLIYDVKCNGLIPWATVHHDLESDQLSPPATMRVSGNANSPIKTNNGQVELTKAYYHFKQISRAGQPGMAVAHVESNDPQVTLIAFAANGTANANAVTIINNSQELQPVNLAIRGITPGQATGFVTTDPTFGDRNHEQLDQIDVADGRLRYPAPPRSATTFYFE